MAVSSLTPYVWHAGYLCCMKVVCSELSTVAQPLTIVSNEGKFAVVLFSQSICMISSLVSMHYGQSIDRGEYRTENKVWRFGI